MKKTIVLVLIVFGLSPFLMQKLSAAQALVVASNGKWAMVYKPDNEANFDTVSAQAISECKAKGGADARIVWSKRSNLFYTGHTRGGPGGAVRYTIAHGAIAVSDNGNGTIVGWSFNHPNQNDKIAVGDCQKKGGQNPKVVSKF